MESVSSTSTSPKLSSITLPGIIEGHYLLFFMTAQAKIPFFLDLLNPFNTQKPESRITYLTVTKKIFITHNNNPTVFLPRSSNSSGPAWRGWYLPSTNSTTNKMPDNAHKSVCQSFPNGWIFQGQKIHPGNFHLLCHMYMYSLRHISQETRKMEVMWSFHAFTICKKIQNLSTYGGGLVLVNLISLVMALNQRLDIDSPKR